MYFVSWELYGKYTLRQFWTICKCTQIQNWQWSASELLEVLLILWTFAIFILGSNLERPVFLKLLDNLMKDLCVKYPPVASQTMLSCPHLILYTPWRKAQYTFVKQTLPEVLQWAEFFHFSYSIMIPVSIFKSLLGIMPTFSKFAYFLRGPSVSSKFFGRLALRRQFSEGWH